MFEISGLRIVQLSNLGHVDRIFSIPARVPSFPLVPSSLSFIPTTIFCTPEIFPYTQKMVISLAYIRSAVLPTKNYQLYPERIIFYTLAIRSRVRLVLC